MRKLRKRRRKLSAPGRKEMIRALGLEPEGSKRHEKYAYSTAEYWKDIRCRDSAAHRKARKKLGVPEPR